MLSISKPVKARKPRSKSAAAKSSHAHLFDPHEEPGVWFGKGALILGLSGVVHEEDFLNVANGFSPDGRRKLARNAGALSRKGTIGLCFSHPKPLSVLYEFCPELREEIEAADNSAIGAALSFIEEFAGVARTPEGAEKKLGGLAIACFRQFTANSGDMHFHTHAQVMNLVVMEDGQVRAIDSRFLYYMKMTAGAIYIAELSRQIQQRLGLTLDPAQVGFHIQGVPKEVCREFSTRRITVEKQMGENKSPARAAYAALRTRVNKTALTSKELFPLWEKRAAKHGWGVVQAAELASKAVPKRIDDGQFHKAFEAALSKLPVEKRTKRNKIRIGRMLAIELGAGAKGLAGVLTGQKQQFVRIEWRSLVRKAPEWSPVRRLKAPRIVIGHKDYVRRWGRIHAKRILLGQELRVQSRRIFPRAPKWSPVSKLSLPAFHIVGKPILEIKAKPLFKEAKKEELRSLFKIPVIRTTRSLTVAEWQRNRWRKKFGTEEHRRREERYKEELQRQKVKKNQQEQGR